MLKTTIAIIACIFFNGCASSTTTIHSLIAPKSLGKILAPRSMKPLKYVSNDGCHMLSNGYLVCPKMR